MFWFITHTLRSIVYNNRISYSSVHVWIQYTSTCISTVYYSTSVISCGGLFENILNPFLLCLPCLLGFGLTGGGDILLGWPLLAIGRALLGKGGGGGGGGGPADEGGGTVGGGGGGGGEG